MAGVTFCFWWAKVERSKPAYLFSFIYSRLLMIIKRARDVVVCDVLVDVDVDVVVVAVAVVM